MIAVAKSAPTAARAQKGEATMQARTPLAAPACLLSAYLPAFSRLASTNSFVNAMKLDTASVCEARVR